jgi:prepilin-type N-terminal cleavage/methylation domain-containing protein
LRDGRGRGRARADQAPGTRARSGFTLVELIVTLLIVGMVIAVSVTFLTTGSNFLNRTETNAADKALAEKAADFIKERLLYANEVRVMSGRPLPSDLRDMEILFIGEAGADGKAQLANTGRLFYQREGDAAPVDVFGAALYKDNKLALTYEAIVTGGAVTGGAGASGKSASFDVDAKVVREGEQTQNARQIFLMPNIGQESEPLTSGAITSWDKDAPDDPAKSKKFYLLISYEKPGYVKDGLILQLDGINNSIDASGAPFHDPGATTIWKDISGNGNDLQFSGNAADLNNMIKDHSLLLNRGNAYALTNAPIFTSYSAVTIEVCFRPAVNNMQGMLYEYGNRSFNQETGIGIWTQHNGSGSFAGNSDLVQIMLKNGSLNNAVYQAPGLKTNTAAFTTHSNSFSMTAGEYPYKTWIDGNEAPLYNSFPTAGVTSPLTPLVQTRNAVGRNFIQRRLTISSNNFGAYAEYASVRIYGRRLTDAEVARNYAEDRKRFW